MLQYLLLSLLFIILCVLFRIFYLGRLMLNDLDRKAILVTGSSSGFGKAFVEKCLDSGVTVFAGCRTENGVKIIEKSCEGKKGRLFAFVMDISSEEQVRDAKLFIENELKNLNSNLHALVNNAGIQGTCFFDDFLNVDSYKEAVEVNTYGTIRVTQTFKKMLKESKGRIVTCTSIVTIFPFPGLGPYSLSKWALSGYSETIRYELRKFGVDVITIEPGTFRTSLNDIQKLMTVVNDTWRNSSKEKRDEYGEYWFSYGKRICIKIIEKSTNDLSQVTDDYFHAVFAKYPYMSYLPGVDAYFVFRPISWLCPSLRLLVMKFMEWLLDVPTPAAVDT